VTATGFSPRAVCVRPGGSVTFTNSDTVAHDIEAGAPCPQLNLAPIAAGGNATVTFPTAVVCAFFDAAHSSDAAFQGTVAVTTGRVEGPGY
jgi:plastocyanin